MNLKDLIGVIETCQTVTVYKVGCDGFCYQGIASRLPERLYGLKVESVHAYEWEIEVLVVE